MMSWKLLAQERLGSVKKLEGSRITSNSKNYINCSSPRLVDHPSILVWKEIEYGGMSEKEKQQLVKEVNLLREFRHPHIVRYYDRIIEKQISKLYIVMEYCSGGDLSILIAKTKKERKFLDEDFIWCVMRQLLSALGECHRKREDNGGKVLHRDIKPANVFLDANGNVKLGDFGLARILHDTSLAKTFVGTPYYMSPEQFQYRSYDHKCDMWSLGCLLYELCALSPPFPARNEKELMDKICHGYFSRIPVQYSDKLQSVIASLLHVNPERRPSVTHLLSTVLDQFQEPKKIGGVKGGVVCDEEEVLRAREQAISNKERELYDREKEVRRKEESLVKREQQLRAREKQLMAMEKRLIEKKVARVRPPLDSRENYS